MPSRNFENRTLFHGDNLGFLRGMNSETVDLIATDPPFNKGRDFHATPDSLAKGASFVDRWRWDEDVHPEWVDQIKDDWPAVHAVIQSARVASGNDIAAFLCWLGVRLIEMRRVLKPTGSLYLHIDHTAHAWAKALMDGIFGRSQFRNEIVWWYAKWTNTASQFQQNHDTLLYYVKSSQAPFNKQYGAPTKRQRELRAAGYNLGSQGGRKILRVYDREKAAHQIAKAEREARAIYYVDTPLEGNPLPDVWQLSALNGRARERTGYPTQKPLALYERIIKASSNLGDMVLDPFAGCATTPVAAERLGRQWVGIDIWDRAYKTVLDRLESEGLAIPRGGGRGEENAQRLITFGDVHYRKEPPVRTDEGEVSAPTLRLRLQRATEPWQRLTHAEIVERLIEAQASDMTFALVICAGCGRELEREFMQLDHINPRAQGGANDITNRILLCQPCNGRKSARFTLWGLVVENKRVGWMKNEHRANVARDQARLKADLIRDGLA